ncbi:TPM domain-containing protein [Flavobacterium sp. LHD-80]|uniref:TPM domain-containing protein n=1 Tax=Flavobacterium sp. LHD-80 TaxID=3071411 RepID=UPI0027E159AE|nr:TPM domain-containing protein [Flavobacterium sp. LHD-80]MDQ6469146.1 TPM domain-containing protein [Flavobacterium sp. LHD-80]
MKKIILNSLLLFTSLIYCQSKENDERYFKFQYDTIVEKTFVLDFEKLFDQTETKELNNLILDFEKATSIEIAIITFDEKYKSDEDFHQNTLFVANWIGIGKKELNNGILIGISKKSRKIRIENGTGIESILTDEETKSIIDNSFIPYFKEKQMYKGTLVGIKKLIEILKVKLEQGRSK